MNEYIQHCFGEYDEVFCEGNPDAQDLSEVLPCDRRDVCRAFQLYLEEAQKEKVDYFEVCQGVDENGEEYFFADIGDQESFLSFCGKLVDRYCIHAKTIEKKTYKVVDKKKRKKPNKKVREAKAKKLKKGRMVYLREVFEKFQERLEARLPIGMSVAKNGTLPLPGQIYFVNKTELYRYSFILLNLKIYGKKDLEILRLVPRYNDGKFSAIFKFDKEVVSECLGDEITSYLVLKDDREGCETKPLDIVGMNILTEAVALFVERENGKMVRQ